MLQEKNIQTAEHRNYGMDSCYCTLMETKKGFLTSGGSGEMSGNSLHKSGKGQYRTNEQYMACAEVESWVIGNRLKRKLQDLFI